MIASWYCLVELRVLLSKFIKAIHPYIHHQYHFYFSSYIIIIFFIILLFFYIIDYIIHHNIFVSLNLFTFYIYVFSPENFVLWKTIGLKSFLVKASQNQQWLQLQLACSYPYASLRQNPTSYFLTNILQFKNLTIIYN